MPIIKTDDIPSHAARKQAAATQRNRRKARTSDVSSKAFEDLTAPEKDALLKELLVRFGYIQDSD